VRRGRSSVEASSSELRELFNRFGFVLTEEQVVLGSTVENLDLGVFRDFLEPQGLEVRSEPQPALEQDILNRGLAAEDDGKLVPTLYGLLCFGRNPQSPPPTSNAWIECVAYKGLDRADEVILTGKARSAYRNKLQAIVGSKVLFEVFADCVVITSPGELPNCLREESALAGGHPRSRNELMANFLLVRGLMEKRGRGLPIVRREMITFNGTEPSLCNERLERYVRLTLWRRKPTA